MADVSGPSGNLDYRVAHGPNFDGRPNVRGPPPCFICVRNAGTGECDGVYKPGNRRWLDHDVYVNRYGDCIISREATTNPRTGDVRHGFVLGKDGRPLYGARTERLVVPSTGWRAFQGHEPVPEILTFKTWSDACQHGAWYFLQEAESAAKGGHWKVVVMMADRAFDCHTNARPKGRGDLRDGGFEWSEQLCGLLGTRAEALLHLGDYKRALVDSCAAVHFIAAYEWSKARTRGITACLNLGVEEEQAKLLMEEMCKRSDREFPGVKALEPLVDVLLERARQAQLRKAVVPEEGPPDDGRIYFRVVDPEDCKMYSRPDWTAKVIGKCDFNDILRGEQILRKGTWLELHVSEEWDDSWGHRRAYVPIYTDEPEEDREEIIERLKPREYPRVPRWEELKLSLRPVGMKPPNERVVPQEYGRWHDPEPTVQKPWPYVYKHGLAICCMLRYANDHVVDSFVRYHWLTGWNHIFLYFDDPKDPCIEHARKLEEFCSSQKAEGMDGLGLSVIKMDAAWWQMARGTSRFFQRREKNQMYESVCKLHDKPGEVESRRVIVTDVAVLEAQRMGIDWFASIDIDECVYVPKVAENSARRFLGSKERSVEYVRLWNHEAVPERVDVTDWFRDSTLFQINRFHCQGFKPPREYDELLRAREGREFEPAKPRGPECRWWGEIMAKIYLRRQAATRRLKLELPRLPRHEPLPLEAGGGGGGPRACVAGGDENAGPEKEERPGGDDDAGPEKEARLGEGEKLVDTLFGFQAYEGGKCVVRLDSHFPPPLPYGAHSYLADSGGPLKECYRALSADDAVILHYPNASCDHWKEKYEKAAKPESPGEQPSSRRLHIASCHVVPTKGFRDKETFYKTFIMQNEHNELAVLAEHGLVTRIDGVRNLLYWHDEPHEPNEVLPGHVQWVDANTGLKLADRWAR